MVLALFYPAIAVLTWVMESFLGGNPGNPVMVDGQETFPLVPVAVGMFSIFFNIFNVIILFPFVNTFERVLSRIGHTAEEDEEDYSVPRYLDKKDLERLPAAVISVHKENERALEAGRGFIAVARGAERRPKDVEEHAESVDALSREIRAYAAHLFQHDLTADQADLVAGLIEEADHIDSLNESLHQVARRAERAEFSPAGQAIIEGLVSRIENSMNAVDGEAERPRTPAGAQRDAELAGTRAEILGTTGLPDGEKGALLALLGTVDRAESVVDRLQTARASVSRHLVVAPQG